MPFPVRLCASALLLASPAWAGPQGDWFASLYSGEGIELRQDERVFALFSVFNAVGFDEGAVVRRDPVPKVRYGDARVAVRERVNASAPEVRKAADAFCDAHPQSLSRYLGYALSAGPPPFAPPKTRELSELKGLEGVLTSAWTAWRLDELMGSVQPASRAALKAYLPLVDAPMGKARRLLRVPEASESLLVMNLLDSQDQVRAIRSGADEVVIVLGPSEQPNVRGLLREYARVWLEPALGLRANSWSGGRQLLREAQLAGAPDQTVAEYATTLFSLAVSLRAMEADEAAYAAAAAQGYWGVKELGRMFDDRRGVEAWAMDGLTQIEAKRPAKK